MALTEIQIANMALTRLGDTNLLTGTTISAIDVTAGLEEQQIYTWYHHCRQRVLRDYPWGFAMKMAELQIQHGLDDGTNPWSGRWAAEFRYPTDALLIRAVRYLGEARNNPVPNPYEVSSDADDRVIRTNVYFTNASGLFTAIGEYTLDVTDVGIYSDDPKFVSAFSALLAFEMAPGLKADPASAVQAWQLYRAEILSAERSDANEDGAEEEPDGSFVSKHRGG